MADTEMVYMADSIPSEGRKEEFEYGTQKPPTMDHEQDSTSSSEEEDGQEEEDDDYEERERVRERIDSLRKELRATTGLVQDKESQTNLIAKYRDAMAPQKNNIEDQADVGLNLLYIMADSTHHGEQNHPWLVKYLVDQHPTLLQEPDKGNETALFVAITKNKVDFVKEVLESSIPDSKLQPVIERAGVLSGNCIHKAILNNFDASTTIGLIKRASPKALSSKDQTGLTPLHYAVDYERCTVSRLRVVRTLIQYSDGAFDQITGKPNHFSVYQYHVDTERRFNNDREKEKKKASKIHGYTGLRKDGTKTTESARSMINDKRHERNHSREQSKDRGKSMYVKEKGKETDVPVSDRNGAEGSSQQEPAQTLRRTATMGQNSSGSISHDTRAPAAAYRANETRQYSTAEAPVSKTRAQGEDIATGTFRGVEDQTEAPKRPKTKKTKRTLMPRSKAIAQEPPSAEVAARIARELKLHYLRSTFRENGVLTAGGGVTVRNHDSAVRFLFGENKEDKQICFDFSMRVVKKDEQDKLVFKDFEDSYAGFKFDDVLQYVRFGHIELDRKLPRSRRQGQVSDSSPGEGREDIACFFDWLRTKKVSNIIKVTVEDRVGTPHSDEAIERALSGFNVEILEWRKVDIDPQAIWSACRITDQAPVLRELHLWWSGNNAILRAWSETDGLGKLPELVTVHIYQAQAGLDSSGRTRSNIAEFKARMEQHRDGSLAPINITYHGLEEPFAPNRRRIQTKDADQRSQLDSHRWLEIMDRLADGIFRIGTPPGCSDDFLTDSKLPSELQKDVKIALIDDGADFLDPTIAKNMDSGRGFGTSEPFHKSCTGHGTWMAYMMSRICPNVKIFVCKLDVLRHESGRKANFTARSAADAVEFAVSRDFDIISMSWTVEKNQADPDNEWDMSRLQRALEIAKDKKMLVFCSAPDIGNVRDSVLSNHYPFGCDFVSKRIFKIGAAKADGTTLGWTGDSESVNFTLPGDNVMPRKGDRISEEKDTPRTGSSVATALAAGLAALLIYVVRLAAVHDWHKPPGGGATNTVGVDTLRAIRTFDVMNKALAKVRNKAATVTGNEAGRRDRNFEVDTFFSEPAKLLLSTAPEAEKWEKIRQLARELVPWSEQTRRLPDETPHYADENFPHELVSEDSSIILVGGTDENGRLRPQTSPGRDDHPITLHAPSGYVLADGETEESLYGTSLSAPQDPVDNTVGMRVKKRLVEHACYRLSDEHKLATSQDEYDYNIPPLATNVVYNGSHNPQTP